MSASYAIMQRSRADLRLRGTIDADETATADAVRQLSVCSGASGIAAPQGRADRRCGDHPTAREKRKRQVARSHDRCDRARRMCGARRAMFGAAGSNVRSSTLQCAELVTWRLGAPSASAAGNSEFLNIPSFRRSSNTMNIPLRMDPPVLSCPVLFCGHAPFGQMSESMRTESGHDADRMRTQTAF